MRWLFQGKPRIKWTILFLCIVLLFSGCSQEAVPLMDTQIEAVEYSSGTVFGEGYRQSFLSKDICVIPKKSKSPTDSAITAESALLVNDTKKKMLFAKKIYAKRFPASITKIATALLALQRADMEDVVTVSYDASHITEYGAKLCHFQEGDQIKMKDLMYCLLVYSGNDAGIAIAEHIGGSQEAFAEMLNEEMLRLGATGTHFVNSHGLHDDSHYTTAYDLYLIFHELLQYDLFREIINQSEYTVSWQDAQGQSKTTTYQSTDRYLLGYEQIPEGLTVIGGKTGTTIAAGNCLILYSQDKKKNDYISVILKADSSTALYSQMNHLLEYTKRGR